MDENAGQRSHPAAVPSLHVTWTFLRKWSLMSSVCCPAAWAPAAPSCPGSAGPPVLLLLPAGTSAAGTDWPASPAWIPPVLFEDLPPALAFRLFWAQIPPSNKKNARWPSMFMSEETGENKSSPKCAPEKQEQPPLPPLSEFTFSRWTGLESCSSGVEWCCCWGENETLRRLPGAGGGWAVMKSPLRFDEISDELYSATIWIRFPAFFPFSFLLFFFPPAASEINCWRNTTRGGPARPVARRIDILFNIFAASAHAHRRAFPQLTTAQKWTFLTFIALFVFFLLITVVLF